MINLLSHEETLQRWSEIQPFIDKAVAHGMQETSSLDMLKGVLTNNYVCWELFDNNNNSISFGMLRLNTFEDHTQLQIVTATGEGVEEYFKEGLDFAEEYGRQLGCKYVTIWGRLGWPRKLKNHGYKHIYSVCAKEL